MGARDGTSYGKIAEEHKWQSLVWQLHPQAPKILLHAKF